VTDDSGHASSLEEQLRLAEENGNLLDELADERDDEGDQEEPNGVRVETKIHVTLQEGTVVSAYRTVSEARYAVESGAERHANEVEYVPNVPLRDLVDWGNNGE